MKIAFVFDGLGFGGIERVGIDYINLCLHMGHEVDIYNLSPKNDALVADRIENYIKGKYGFEGFTFSAYEFKG